MLEVKPRRVGGATYQVPVQIEGRRRQSLAIRWIAGFGEGAQRQVDGREARQRDARCGNNTGATIKRREDTHRMAEANKAFAHYRY